MQFLVVTNDVFDDSGLHYVTVWFTGRTTPGSGRVGCADEVVEFGWFDLDRLPRPLLTPFENLRDGRCIGRGGADLLGKPTVAPR